MITLPKTNSFFHLAFCLHTFNEMYHEIAAVLQKWVEEMDTILSTDKAINCI